MARRCRVTWTNLLKLAGRQSAPLGERFDQYLITLGMVAE